MNLTNEQIHAVIKKVDARRIAACITACEGISTENLINNVPLKQGLAGLNKLIRDAEAQRDELLAEREADKALIAEQAKRIAVLEVYPEAEAAGADKVAGDAVYWMKRCKELEARTLTVAIKPPTIGRAYSALNHVWAVKEVREACAAAGITLVVGGE